MRKVWEVTSHSQREARRDWVIAAARKGEAVVTLVPMEDNRFWPVLAAGGWAMALCMRGHTRKATALVCGERQAARLGAHLTDALPKSRAKAICAAFVPRDHAVPGHTDPSVTYNVRYGYNVVVTCTCRSFMHGNTGRSVEGLNYQLKWCKHLTDVDAQVCSWVGPAQPVCPECGGKTLALPLRVAALRHV